MATKQVTTLRMEKKFKKTPAGEIPVEWEIEKLSDACIVNPSKSEMPDLLDDAKVSFIPMENVRVEAGGIIALNEREFKEVKNGYTYFKENDILFAKITPCMENGKVAIAKGLTNGVGFGSTEFHVLRPKNDRLTREFLYYWISQQSFRELARKHFTGTAGQQRVQKAFFSLVNIPLPSSPEQKKIAEILFAVDEAIEKTDAVIEKTKQLKKGLMQKLLTRGLGHKKFKKTELGEIPAEWEVLKLGEHLDVYSGYAFKSQDFLERGEGSIPVIKIGNLQNGIVTFDDKTDYVSEKLYDELVGFRLGKGDVLIALSGATTGKISVVHKDLEHALVNQRVGKFKILNTTKMLPEFFYYLAQADVFKKIVLVNIGKGAQENLSPLELKKQMIPLPPLPEQQKIAEILSVVDDEISMEENRKKQLEQTKKSLMQVLLTGKVRVSVREKGEK